MAIYPLKTSLFFIMALLLLTGCAADRIPSRSHWTCPRVINPPEGQALQIAPVGVSLFDGHTGESLSWDAMLDALAWSQITLIGEQHFQLAGDRVTRCIIADGLSRRLLGAVSLEMLYRDEAPSIAMFNDRQLDAKAFASQTGKQDKKTWAQSYEPLLQFAQAHKVRLIASNAPRRLVKLARHEGFDALRQLPANEQDLFELPVKLRDQGKNYRRFNQAVSEHPGHEMTPQDIHAMYLSQRVWDATMADSMINGLAQYGPTIIQVVGQFHSDRDGGVVLSLLDRQPKLRLLTISLQPGESLQLKQEDQLRADIVIYVGNAKPKE
jgi:uncharacterized iron-regulated protein